MQVRGIYEADLHGQPHAKRVASDTSLEGAKMTHKRHRLVSIRKAAGFSQERLAEALGVERSTVVRWERGETCPQPWARPKLARALGISDQALSKVLCEPAELKGAAAPRGMSAMACAC